jgi:hypothetical protein
VIFSGEIGNLLDRPAQDVSRGLLLIPNAGAEGKALFFSRAFAFQALALLWQCDWNALTLGLVLLPLVTGGVVLWRRMGIDRWNLSVGSSRSWCGWRIRHSAARIAIAAFAG